MSNPYPLRYINLAKDTVRRDRMEAQLQKAHVDGVRLDAVWWKTLADSEQAQYYSEEKNRQQYYQALVNGEKGCYASHICAWRALLDSDAPGMIVLEDDVTLHTDFSTVIGAIARLPDNWDMIKLMGRPGKEKVLSAQPLAQGHDLIRYRRVPSFTAAYVISRAGAEKMLQTRVPFGRPIDIDLRFWWENGMRIYGVYPAIVELDETSQDTSIAGRSSRKSLGTRWKKLCMKLALSWGNWRHLHAHSRPGQ